MKSLREEIPGFNWDRVKNSVHLGRPDKDRISGTVVIVKTWPSGSKGGPCLGYLCVSRKGEWVKFWTKDPIVGWRAGRRLKIHDLDGIGVVKRHDTSPTGLKSTVLYDMDEDSGTIIGKAGYNGRKARND